ncbi:hypothetical protein [Caulobacter sp. 17J65-9]|uniref:hypothetical protein n=1 Tax=Caulobacter sp. 17J65-9 TaxID=2709382 RepID=UPI0013C853FF|nr:hypothetical protein [Caulobacter sp. 17J65-9]NEX94429.1 hypothetical protein [Caulobacter sp. 17J65-9]
MAEAAAAYETYVSQAKEIQANFTDGESIQASLRKGESYEAKQLAQGVIAYGAVLALQEPTFVAGVRELGREPAQRQQIINQIFADPAYAAQLPGADAAAGRVVAELTADGAAVHKAGSAVKQSAYDVQRQKWSKEFVKEREARLAAAKQISSQPIAPSTDLSAQLLQAALSGTGLPSVTAGAEKPYTPAVQRSLAIAALAALGAAGDDNATQVSALLEDNVGPSCLNLSKLNLYQCLAVSKPHYEDVFCLGQHVLMDTGQCITKVAGKIAPVGEPIPLPAAPAALDAASNTTNAVQTEGPKGGK